MKHRQSIQFGHYRLADRLRSLLALGLLTILLLAGCAQPNPDSRNQSNLPILSISMDAGLSTIDVNSPEPDGSFTLAEGATPDSVTFNVSMSKTSPQEVYFYVGYKDFYSEARVDYDLIQTGDTVAGQKITIPPNQDGASFTLEIIDDSFYDPDETFEVYFARATGAELTQVGYRFNIADDDAPPTITLHTAPSNAPDSRVSSASYVEGNGSIPLILALPSGTSFRNPTQIECQVTGGTATLDEDFSDPCPLTFPAGNQEAILQLPVINDIQNEGGTGSESLTVELLNYVGPAPVAYNLGFPVTVTLDIVDDDGSWGIPGTGADQCVDETATWISCGSADAAYSPARQDSSGTTSTFDTASPSPPCAYDATTGLLWEVKSSDNADVQYGDALFSWFNPAEKQNGGEEGTENGGSCTGSVNCDSYSYIAHINSISLCGSSNWRLPTLQELHTMIDYGQRSKGTLLIDTAAFPNTTVAAPVAGVPVLYWTSTPAAVFKQVWAVDVNSGASVRIDPSIAEVSSTARIRLVTTP